MTSSATLSWWWMLEWYKQCRPNGVNWGVPAAGGRAYHQVHPVLSHKERGFILSAKVMCGHGETRFVIPFPAKMLCAGISLAKKQPRREWRRIQPLLPSDVMIKRRRISSSRPGSCLEPTSGTGPWSSADKSGMTLNFVQPETPLRRADRKKSDKSLSSQLPSNC